MKDSLSISDAHEIDELLLLAHIHHERTGLARATISTKVMNDGKFFDRIEVTRDCTLSTYHKVKRWFKENTPSKVNKS